MTSEINTAFAQLRELCTKFDMRSVVALVRQDGRVTFEFIDQRGYHARTVHADLGPGSAYAMPGEALESALGVDRP